MVQHWAIMDRWVEQALATEGLKADAVQLTPASKRGTEYTVPLWYGDYCVFPVFALLPHVCCFDHKHRRNAKIQSTVTRKPSFLRQTHLWAFGPVCCVCLKMAGERYPWHHARVFSLWLCLKTQEPGPVNLPYYSDLARPFSQPQSQWMCIPSSSSICLPKIL